WRVIEALSAVALPAGNDDMQSHERVLGLVVIEVHVLPPSLRMTLIAFLAESPAVGLVGAVAIQALGAQLLVLCNSGVTGVEVQLLVGAVEWEFEPLEMVEGRHFPDVVAVAVPAGGSQPAGVLVIRLVASGAILRNRLLQVAAAVAVATPDPR